MALCSVSALELMQHSGIVALYAARLGGAIPGSSRKLHIPAPPLRALGGEATPCGLEDAGAHAGRASWLRESSSQAVSAAMALHLPHKTCGAGQQREQRKSLRAGQRDAEASNELTPCERPGAVAAQPCAGAQLQQSSSSASVDVLASVVSQLLAGLTEPRRLPGCGRTGNFLGLMQSLRCYENALNLAIPFCGSAPRAEIDGVLTAIRPEPEELKWRRVPWIGHMPGAQKHQEYSAIVDAYAKERSDALNGETRSRVRGTISIVMNCRGMQHSAAMSAVADLRETNLHGAPVLGRAGASPSTAMLQMPSLVWWRWKIPPMWTSCLGVGG
ncbi:unnamed protein product [Effrenium voratum]|nr:unnamed protein product [Effrenium voratum]